MFIKQLLRLGSIDTTNKKEIGILISIKPYFPLSKSLQCLPSNPHFHCLHQLTAAAAIGWVCLTTLPVRFTSLLGQCSLEKQQLSFVESNLRATMAEHNNINIKLSRMSYISSKMMSILNHISLDVIGIDEAQFFGDLYDFCCKVADHDGKTVIVAGLDRDYLRQKTVSTIFPGGGSYFPGWRPFLSHLMVSIVGVFRSAARENKDQQIKDFGHFSKIHIGVFLNYPY
ncbi:hypothetical protein HYC85_021419 [Camellia sinensis]|uniref:Thymidine kinase n=1 Tax=Camellia sinensis TaxID=4442 RepID=A0A7J7GHK7_CAMSI|nr:hypothetical protein HYC85_021419 [Camellia sinensis]